MDQAHAALGTGLFAIAGAVGGIVAARFVDRSGFWVVAATCLIVAMPSVFLLLPRWRDIRRSPT
jgi:predicted MFS family arabinose efflux permease